MTNLSPPDRTIQAIRNRIGTFSIDRHVLETADRDVLFGIMSKVFVVRCEMDYASDRFMYNAISAEFAPVEKGMIAPEYMVTIDRSGNGMITDIYFTCNGPDKDEPAEKGTW